MDHDILDGPLFLTREESEHALNAGLFGCWCAHVAVPTQSPPSLACIWSDVSRGIVPQTPDELRTRIQTVAQIVGLFHPTRDTAHQVVHQFEAIDPESTAVSAGAAGFALTKCALTYLETYVFGCLWPGRMQTLIAEATLVDAPAAIHVNAIKVWTMEVAVNMKNSAIESACRQIYCGAVMPVAVAKRAGSNKTAYECYRDYNDETPVPSFSADIELVAKNPPRLIICNKLAKDNALIETCAYLSIFMTFLNTTCDLPTPMRVNTSLQAGFKWCQPWTIYIVKDAVYLSVMPGVLVKPASMSGPDIAHAFITHASARVPGNPLLRHILNVFDAAVVDEGVPEWAA